MSSMKERWSKFTWLDKTAVIVTFPVTLPIACVLGVFVFVIYGMIAGIGFIFNMREE